MQFLGDCLSQFIHNAIQDHDRPASKHHRYGTVHVICQHADDSFGLGFIVFSVSFQLEG